MRDSVSKVVLPPDNTKNFADQQIVGHNRWHPDIPAQVQVKPQGSTLHVRLNERRDRPEILGPGRRTRIVGEARRSAATPSERPVHAPLIGIRVAN